MNGSRDKGILAWVDNENRDEALNFARAMSDYKDIFRTKGSQNWCKAWTAVHILRDGLKDWVSDEMQNYLASILPAGPGCTTCTTSNALPCQTRNICKVNRGHCTYHDTHARHYKSCAVHDSIRDAINKEHRFPNPSWMNTQAEHWTTSSWEIAKCFMPVGGYLDKLTADDTDFNGIVSPVINCKRFQNLMTANMSDPKNNICAEVRNKVNKIRHLKNMEPTISEVDLTNYIDLFIDLLNDAKSLQNDPRAIDARDKLNKLKTDTLVITTKDVERILQDASCELKKVHVDGLTKMQDFLDAALKKCLELIEEKGLQERKQIGESGSKERNQIEDTGSQERKQIKNTGSQERTEIENSGSKEIKQIEDTGSQERSQIKNTGSQERTEIENSGSKERKQIGDSGSKERNQIEESGSKERKQTKDTGFQERVQIKDSGSQERSQIKDTGSQERSQIKDEASQERSQIKDEASQERSQIKDEAAQERKRIEDFLNTQTECEFHSKKEALKKELVEFNQKNHSTLPVSPLIPNIDAALDKFYVMPQLQEICTGPESRLQSENPPEQNRNPPEQNRKPLQFYGEMFTGDKHQDVRNIYVQGKPGSGKSSFCKKLVMDWCKLNETTSSEESVDSNESSTMSMLDTTRDFVSDTDTSESNTDNTDNTDISDLDPKKESKIDGPNPLNQFDFLFLLSLRDAREDTCDIDKMIFKQIVLGLAAAEGTYSQEFITKLLSTERCLIILDGLDEWTHPKHADVTCGHTRSSKDIPHRKSRKKCTILTTSRHSKMAEVPLKDSEIEKLIELTGITDTRKLIRNVLNYLNGRYSKAKQTNDFIKHVKKGNLDHMMEIPVILMQLLCLWYEDKPFGKSRCEVYSNMIDMMMQIGRSKSEDVRDSNGQILKLEKSGGKLIPNINSKKYEDIIERLCKLAFNTLFSDDEVSSTVFSEEEVKKYMPKDPETTALDDEVSSTVFSESEEKKYMPKDTETTALESGILTKQQSRNGLTDRPTTYCFIHKTFQEFFAALYISQSENGEGISERLTQTTRSNLLDIFVFVCGLNKNRAEQCSEFIMNKYANEKCDNESKYILMTQTVQTVIVNGYNESIDNGHEDVNMSLHCAVFHNYNSSIHSDINRLLQMDENRRNICTLIVTQCSSDIGKELVKLIGVNTKCLILDKALTSQLLDLSGCSNLQCIEFGHMARRYGQQVKINAATVTRLEICDIQCMDRNPTDGILSALAGGTPMLKSLKIDNCDIPEHLLHRFSDICSDVTTLALSSLKLNVDLDLSSCQQLKHILISGSMKNIKLPSCLQTCSIGDSRQVQHGVLTSLKAGAPVLTKLYIHNCHHSTLLCQTLPYLHALQSLLICDTNDTEPDSGLEQLHTSIPDSINEIRLMLKKLKPEHGIKVIERILQLEHSVEFVCFTSDKDCHGIIEYMQKSDRFRLVKKLTHDYTFVCQSDNQPKQVTVTIHTF